MRANGTTARVKAVAKQTGKSISTIWRWARHGCNLNSPASIREHQEGNELRQHANLIRKGKGGKPIEPIESAAPDLNLIALGPVGARGAAAALKRLEAVEERAHARLMRAIEEGNPFQIKAAQEFYLRSIETLRRLDLAVETERRKADEQLRLRQVSDVARTIGTWFAGSFARFLSAESLALMSISDLENSNITQFKSSGRFYTEKLRRR